MMSKESLNISCDTNIEDYIDHFEYLRDLASELRDALETLEEMELYIDMKVGDKEDE